MKKNVVYYSWGSLVLLLVCRLFVDGSFQKTTIGAVLFALLAGGLWGAVDTYLDPRASFQKNISEQARLMIAMGAILLIFILYHGVTMLGMPVVQVE